MSELLELGNSLAGVAALVNGLLLWPVVRHLRRDVDSMKKRRKRARSSTGSRSTGAH